MADREHDIVLFGATGFTGGLTAEYLALHAAADVRWALAGRNLGKLEAVRARLATLRPECGSLPLLAVDAAGEVGLGSLARSARVVISTVGPYLRFGEPLVAACAAAGCGYADLTGEPEFVDLMYLRYGAQAVASGARLVHSCGFDSIPHDLGALWTVSQLPDDVPIALSGYVRARGTISGGTLHSAVAVMARLRQGAAVARRRRAQEGVETVPPGRRVHGTRTWPRAVPEAGGWVVPAPTIDPIHVLRSARALPAYGPDFSYAHTLVTGGVPATAALIAGTAMVAGLAQLPPTRSLLLRLRAPGAGPSAEQRARSSFTVRFVARTPLRRLVTEVSGGDPGYGETAKMLAESALCLAFDQLPERAGQLTPAVAMGDALISRLRTAGLRFAVVE
jgi:short subunit dehydrogenase-like uncharacterized protein